MTRSFIRFAPHFAASFITLALAAGCQSGTSHSSTPAQPSTSSAVAGGRPAHPERGEAASSSTEPAASTAVNIQTSAKPQRSPRRTFVMGHGEVIAKGVISREKTEFTANEDFVAGRGAKLQIELRRYEGEDTGAPLVLGGSTDIPEGVLEFPIEYEIRGNRAAFSPDQTYFISAELTQGTGGAGPAKLITEYRNELNGSESQKDFVVSGLEPCGAPNAGGFCGG